MKKSVIVQTNVKDKVRLEDKYDQLTIGLSEGGDFHLVINFTELTIEDLKILAQLSKLPRRLSIKSDITKKEQYNISHIVVTKFTAKK